MKLKYLLLTVFSIVLIVGCSNKPVIENANDIDIYGEVKAAAWNFLHEEGWQDQAKDDFQSAKVEKAIANTNYILLDKTNDGKNKLYPL